MANQVTFVVRALRRDLDKVLRRTLLEVTANLVEPPPRGTPVDTGWARSNWIPSIGVPPPTAPVGSKQAVSGAEQAAGIASVLAAPGRPQQGNVTNNVPYIVSLDQGSSSQSPRGFVAAAIRRAVATVGSTP